MYLKKIIAIVAACAAVSVAAPVHAGTPLPKGFLLGEQAVADDEAEDEGPHDYEDYWGVDNRLKQPFAVPPCSTSVLPGLAAWPKIGLKGRLAARNVQHSTQEFVHSVEQVILYSSAKNAERAMREFKAGWERCRKGRKNAQGDVFRRSLTGTALGDQAWKSRGTSTGVDQDDAAVIVRRANAVIVYLHPRDGKPSPKDFPPLVASARTMLAKICQVAACG